MCIRDRLIGVLQKLIEHGATVVVIKHDLDMIANADYVIDMGPGGGETGGRIVAEGLSLIHIWCRSCRPSRGRADGSARCSSPSSKRSCR